MPRRRRAAAPPKVVLLWCVVLFAVATGMYAVAPWILPVRISEGPMVQMASETGVMLVWYTTRSAETSLRVTVDGAERTLADVAQGKRHVARIDGLRPATSYPYRIMTGTRQLFGDAAFETNKPAGDRFAFVVFGDSGKGTRAQYTLASLMGKTNPLPDFIVHTGDMVYPDGARWRYGDRFFTPYRRLLARVNFWPCLGNHDIDKTGAAPAFDEVFITPDDGPAGPHKGHNYWFDYAAARVVVLDSNLETASEAVLRDQIGPWLRQVLAEPGPTWHFVSLHHPVHTIGKYQPDTRLARTLVPIFEETGVDVVFCGHDHNYQRWHALRGDTQAEDGRGVVYIVTGGGGGELYTVKSRDQWPSTLAFAASDLHSFTQAVVDGRTLTLRQFDENGKLIDESKIEKPAAATSAPATQSTTSIPATQPAASAPATQPAAP